MATYTKTNNEADKEAGVEVNLKGNSHVYETMHDVQDSENDDDDKVLINRDSKFSNISRKQNGYIGLICHALLLTLFVVVLVLAFFMYSLHKDIKEVRKNAEIQASHIRLYAKKNKALTGRVGKLTTQIKEFPSIVDQTAKLQNDSAAAIKTVGTLSNSLSKSVERASVYYPKFNAKFMGFGYPANRTHWAEYHQFTLEHCLANLYEKHALDKEWNGLAFGHSQKDGWCICYKNSQKLDVHSLHYLYYVLDD